MGFSNPKGQWLEVAEPHKAVETVGIGFGNQTVPCLLNPIHWVSLARRRNAIGFGNPGPGRMLPNLTRLVFAPLMAINCHSPADDEMTDAPSGHFSPIC